MKLECGSSVCSMPVMAAVDQAVRLDLADEIGLDRAQARP